MQTVSILGTHTFSIDSNLSEIERFQVDKPVEVFDGSGWTKKESVLQALLHIDRIGLTRYKGSSRAMPTGFGFIAQDGVIVGYTNGMIAAGAVFVSTCEFDRTTGGFKTVDRLGEVVRTSLLNAKNAARGF